MKRITFVGLVLAILASLLTACGGTPAAQPTTSTGVGQATAPAAAATSAPAAQATSAPAAQATSAPAAQPAGEPIKIGGGFNLTGGLAALDGPAANGAKLAVKEINAAGGVLGRPLELKILDGKSDTTTVGNVVTQLVESEQVIALVGYSDSDSVLAAGPTTVKAGIPFITAGATSPNLPEQVGPNMFLACFGDNVQAAAGAEFAYGKLGYKTSYLLWNKGTEYTKLLGGYFKQRWTELAGTEGLLGEDTYQKEDTDFSAQITKIKSLAKQPDFIYISAYPDEIGSVVKQMRAAGVTLPIIGGDGYDTPELVKVAGPEASNQVYFSTHSLIDAEKGSDAVKQFMVAYKEEYNTDPENAFAALGYDAIKLLADAITRAGSTDSAAVIKALEETKNLAAVTGTINFSPASHIPQKGVTMIEIKDGKFTLAAEVVPEKIPAP